MPILRSRFGTPGGPQREDLDLAASAGRFGFGGKGNNNNYNQRFRWQEPPGKIILRGIKGRPEILFGGGVPPPQPLCD